MGLMFGAVGTGAKMLAKQAGKKIARKTTEKVADHTEKAHDMLSTITGATEGGIKHVLKQANDLSALKSIRDYLQSGRNDIPYNKTMELIAKCTQKAQRLHLRDHMRAARDELLKQIGDPFQLAHELMEKLL